MPLCAPSDTDDKPALSIPNGVSASKETILPICKQVAGKVNAFLESEAETPLLRQVQAQTRIALNVIQEALQHYRYFPFEPRTQQYAERETDNMTKPRRDITLLQRRQRLPRPTHPPSHRSLNPPKPVLPALRPAIRLHYLPAPLPRSRRLRRRLYQRLPALTCPLHIAYERGL